MSAKAYSILKWALLPFWLVWDFPTFLLGGIIWLVNCRKAKRKSQDGISYYLLNSGNPVYGVSLFPFVFLTPQHENRITIHHEWGHEIQAMILGWLYLIVIGIPSGLSNTRLAGFIGLSHSSEYDYYWRFPWERWADRNGKVLRIVNEKTKTLSRTL